MPTSGASLAHPSMSPRRKAAACRARSRTSLSHRRRARDVAHLSPGRTCLPYMWIRDAGVVRQAVQVAAVHVGDVAAEHVGHHHARRGQPGVAERQVEHGAQVLLELAGPRALDGPVAAVVRAHRQLVDEHARRRCRTSRPPSRPVTPSPSAIRSAACWAASAWSSCDRRRRDDLAADAVDLHGLDDRPDRGLPVRAARDQHRQLAVEATRSSASSGIRRSAQPVVGVARLLDEPHALAVVPAPRRLEDHRPADLARRTPPARPPWRPRASAGTGRRAR